MSLRLKLLLSFCLFAALGMGFITIAVYQSYVEAYVSEEQKVIADLLHRSPTDSGMQVPEGGHDQARYLTLHRFADGHLQIISETVALPLKEIMQGLKTAQSQKQALLELEGHRYIWVESALSKPGEKLISLYEVPHDLLQTFIASFGTEFIIIYIISLWAMIWLAMILASLFERLNRQKELLESQTHELEHKHDDALRQSETKSRFLANISHELRAPLNSLLGYSELLLQSDQDMEERISGINTIIRNGEYMLNLINDLLDLSKIEAGKLEIEKQETNLFDVMTDIQHLFASQAATKNIDLEFEYQLPVPETIHTDPVRFKQILINLVSNAIKFTQKGYVKVETACNNDGTLHVYVRDTGIGLTEEQINKIFDEYTQAESTTSHIYGGTGLGLSLSRTLSQLLGGKILVSSIPGKGSVFTLELSTGSVENVKMQYEVPSARHARNIYTPEDHDVRLSGRVLLVEDNVDNQTLFSNYLTRHGLEVSAAFNGKAALGMLTENQYDLIFMDAQMPFMNGVETTRKIRQQHINTPIVAITGNSSLRDIQEFREAGCNEYLSKPIKREQILRVCKLFLPDSDLQNQDRPLYSTLLDEEPELKDLVAGFVSRMPETLRQLEQYLDNDELEPFVKRIHELKGSGGNVGYLEITNLCSQIEFQLGAPNLAEVAVLMERLHQLIPRMQLALNH